MRRKEQRSMLALAIVMALVVGVFWAGPVGAGGGNPCAVLKRAAERVGCPGAPVEKTGQTECYDTDGTSISCTDTGQDGDLEKGVAWVPEERFTDNLDDTVTDNLTGLMWLKEANHIGVNHSEFDNDGTVDGMVTWQHALDFVGSMNDGTYSNCGYTDWRLPNVKELQSLIDYGNYGPALPSFNPFTGVVSDYYWSYYWSSTTFADVTDHAWIVPLRYGFVHYDLKGGGWYVWPVRGGE